LSTLIRPVGSDSGNYGPC